MPKPQYGYAHQVARSEAMALFVDGTPCPICRRPMRVWQSLDLDHATPVVKGGMHGPTRLTHSHCNRKQGGLIGNRSAKRKGGTRIRRVVTNRSAIKDGNTPGNRGRQLPEW